VRLTSSSTKRATRETNDMLGCLKWYIKPLRSVR